MKIQKTLSAITAAVISMSVFGTNIYADTIKEKDGLKYLVSDSGAEKGLYSGRTKKGGKYYYYKNGVLKKNCWVISGGKKKYFLTSDGSCAVGMKTIQGVEYEFDEKGELVPEKWGVELTAENVTPTGLKVVFTLSDGEPTGELSTGSYYTIERYEKGEWQRVEYLPQEYDIGWTAESLGLLPDDPNEYSIKWEWLYGELPEGRYRIGKEVMDFRKPADYDLKMYWAYFEIE